MESSASTGLAGSAPKLVLRLFSGIAGAALLVGSAPLTLGAALFAPFGMFVGRRVTERRGRPFTGLASWVSAALGSGLAIVVALVLAFAFMPDSTWKEIHESTVTAQSQQSSGGGPNWMRPDPATEKIITSPAFTIGVLIIASVFAGIFLGAIAGTPGWLAMLLLSYAIRGRTRP